MSDTTDALGAAVDAEHAAVYTYGVLTAFTTGDRRTAVATYIAEHRARRDELNEALVAAGGQARSTAPGYVLPVQVTNSATAARAALDAEQDTAQAYRSLAERADTAPVRRLAVDGLTECALRGAFWRQASGVRPATVALPGIK
ncbi:ferritin-like domain-containing protein [Gordonia sp. CPCC 205333]|uniref:ferritin-like domain-containing protein n=1 Tax=Gordonia sp. CPCC 205333 TaxID=3140790 RepID=UPI003AF3F744